MASVLLQWSRACRGGVQLTAIGNGAVIMSISNFTHSENFAASNLIKVGSEFCFKRRNLLSHHPLCVELVYSIGHHQPGLGNSDKRMPSGIEAVVRTAASMSFACVKLQVRKLGSDHAPDWTAKVQISSPSNSRFETSFLDCVDQITPTVPVSPGKQQTGDNWFAWVVCASDFRVIEHVDNEFGFGCEGRNGEAGYRGSEQINRESDGGTLWRFWAVEKKIEAGMVDNQDLTIAASSFACLLGVRAGVQTHRAFFDYVEPTSTVNVMSNSREGRHGWAILRPARGSSVSDVLGAAQAVVDHVIDDRAHSPFGIGIKPGLAFGFIFPVGNERPDVWTLSKIPCGNKIVEGSYGYSGFLGGCFCPRAGWLTLNIFEQSFMAPQCLLAPTGWQPKPFGIVGEFRHVDHSPAPFHHIHDVAQEGMTSNVIRRHTVAVEISNHKFFLAKTVFFDDTPTAETVFLVIVVMSVMLIRIGLRIAEQHLLRAAKNAVGSVDQGVLLAKNSEDPWQLQSPATLRWCTAVRSFERSAALSAFNTNECASFSVPSVLINEAEKGPRGGEKTELVCTMLYQENYTLSGAVKIGRERPPSPISRCLVASQIGHMTKLFDHIALVTRRDPYYG